MNKIIFIIIMFSLSSCAHKYYEDGTYAKASLYDLSIAYDGNKHAFNVQLISKSKQHLCISDMEWPHSNDGHFLFGDDNVYVVEGSTRYNIKNKGTGHCYAKNKGDCITRLKPNDTLDGELSINDFNISKSEYEKPGFNPTLFITVRPLNC